MIDSFSWMMMWYCNHCDGDWEHMFGVNIDTVSASVWSIIIDLSETELEDLSMEKVDLKYSTEDWLACYIEENKFKARCAVGNLCEALQFFRKWAISHGSESFELNTCSIQVDSIDWLDSWFKTLSQNDRDSLCRVSVKTLDNPGWVIYIKLTKTILERELFEEVVIDRSDDDWVHCRKRLGVFEGHCGPTNFLEVLKIFRDWVESCRKLES